MILSSLALLMAAALAQPPANVPETAPPAPAVPPPAAPADPPPLEQYHLRILSDRTITTTLGAFLSALELSKAVEAKIPDRAANIQSRREEFTATLGPGAETLFAMLCQRTNQTREKAEAGIRTSIQGGVAKLTSELSADTANAMFEQGRLEPKNAQASMVSTLLTFGPGNMSDGAWLLKNDWKRTDNVELPLPKDAPPKSFTVTFPMSWGRRQAKPGESTWGENAGMGPVNLTVNTRQITGELDLVKSVSAMATGFSGAPVTAEPGTLAGKPSAEATFYQTKKISEIPYRAKSRVIAINADGALVLVTMSVGGVPRPNERQYSDAELDAYAKKREALMQQMLDAMTIIDGPAKPAGEPK